MELANSDIMPSAVSATHPSDIVDVIQDVSAASAGSEPSPSTSTASSTLSISSTTTHDVAPDNNADATATHNPAATPADEVANMSNQNTAESTTAEWAVTVISHSQITPNPTLVIFTVTVTNKPRVVRLFPTISSCPAKANGYCSWRRGRRSAWQATPRNARSILHSYARIRRSMWIRHADISVWKMSTWCQRMITTKIKLQLYSTRCHQPTQWCRK